MLEKAPEGTELKAGIIGCGGRGSGAAINFLDAGPGLTITALGDVFQDRVDSCREKIKAEISWGEYSLPPITTLTPSPDLTIL